MSNLPSVALIVSQPGTTKAQSKNPETILFVVSIFEKVIVPFAFDILTTVDGTLRQVESLS